MNFIVSGNIIDIEAGCFFSGSVYVEDGKIISIEKKGLAEENSFYILPGFIDAHVHIESSMLLPAEFARLAVVHGTVATISDPHEIANVCGIEGVLFMIENGKQVPFKFHFGAPSCVPATIFETAGASLDTEDVDKLLASDEINYLSEMMNFPGVLHADEEVMMKINSAKKYKKPVDGHAPGLRGEDAKKYIEAGISTDHECFTKEDALGKLKYGMKILIREGSAAKNFDALISLLHDHPGQIMFCSDDKHPDSLVSGHINLLCKRAVEKEIDIFKIIKAACINPVAHYNMNVGLLKTGDPADFIVVKDLVNFDVVATYINGILVVEKGVSKIAAPRSKTINNFHCHKKEISEFKYQISDFPSQALAIEALDGQLITSKIVVKPKMENGFYVSDIKTDVLKIVVINRYKDAPVAKGFIKNFGLKKGAIASSVAHDSHNIIAVGVDDESLCKAANLIIEKRGGISCVDSLNASFEKILPLPVGGLMSSNDGYKVAEEYSDIDKAAKQLGSGLSAPFMTLSFMALLVIPHIKLSDLGLFDGDNFAFIK
ncbi:MAG: adenine deaminase [Ginsengibacter sp.]